MLKHLLNIWRNNNGTLLFACGLGVVIVMSILWRLDMIPDIGKTLRTSPMIIGSRVTPLPNIVVVSITSDDLKNAEVVTQLFSNTPSDTLAPLESRTTVMHDGLSEFLITGLARGTYAGIAFVDVNSNGQVDLAEDGSAMEPFGMMKVRTFDESKSLPSGVFELSGDPIFVKIKLLAPKTPVASQSSVRTE